MTVLKDHMLREVFSLLYKRDRTNFSRDYDSTITALTSIEKFVLAGKEPTRSFRRIIEDRAVIHLVNDTAVGVKYYDDQWYIYHSFLNTLFARWARKLYSKSFLWLHVLPLEGCCKILSENSDIAELQCQNLDTHRCHRYNWAGIFKFFPKLVSVRVNSCQFVNMLLEAAPTQLECLNEVVLDDSDENQAAGFLVVVEALSRHQGKCPNLETIRYFGASLTQLQLPESGTSVSTVKHIEVKSSNFSRCCVPFDLGFFSAAQKMFPSLEKFKLDADFYCKCSVRKGITKKRETIEQLYQAFQSLNVGFFVEIVHHDHSTVEQMHSNELYSFFCTKGTVYGEPLHFTAKTTSPGKQLTYEAKISIVPDVQHNYYYDDYAPDQYDIPLYIYYNMPNDDDYDYL